MRALSIRFPILLLIGTIGAYALPLGGCEATIPEGRFACALDEDCPEPQLCQQSTGRCRSQEPTHDAGQGDAQ